MTELCAMRVAPVIPSSDLDRSREFFEGVLGLTGEPAPGGHLLHAGDGSVLYLLDGPSYAGVAEWPLASFATDDLAALTADLRGRGVQLESFADGPQQTDDRGIATLDGMLIAWFRDPDGQVFSMFQLTGGISSGPRDPGQ